MSGVEIADLAPCEICGHPVKVDAIVANDVFAKISPTGDENGYFCANCMVEKLDDKLGWGTVYLSKAPGLEPLTAAAAELAALRSQVSALTDERDRLREGMSQAATDVLAERRRQVDVEGWTPEHDDQYDRGELAAAAACYAAFGWVIRRPPTLWPWADEWWKPLDHRRNLIKSGALILAEIERLDRASREGQADG